MRCLLFWLSFWLTNADLIVLLQLQLLQEVTDVDRLQCRGALQPLLAFTARPA